MLNENRFLGTFRDHNTRTIWDNAANYNLQKLQKVQNRAARILTGNNYDIPSKDVLHQFIGKCWKNAEKIKKHY